MIKSEKVRRYREKHPERVKKTNENWKNKNPDYHKNYSKRWREKNKEKAKAYRKKYLEQNREKNKIQCYAYKYIRKKIIEERKKCEDCGSIDNLELHHKEYKNEGDCLKLLCRKCHAKEHGKKARKSESV